MNDNKDSNFSLKYYGPSRSNTADFKKLFIAIDTGGTKTSIRFSLKENRARVKPDKTITLENATPLSGILDKNNYPEVFENIMEQIDVYWRLNNLNGLEIKTYLFIISAGYALNTKNRFKNELTKLKGNAKYLDGSIVFAGALNDAVALIHPNNADVAVVAGTGSNIVIKNRGGSFCQSGGQDWVAYDNGSGFWIGLRAIRQAAEDFQEKKNTELLKNFKKEYGLSNDDALMTQFRKLAWANPNMKREIAKFAKRVCDIKADADKSEAQAIVKSEAEHLAECVAKEIHKNFSPLLSSQNVKIVLCGRVMNNNVYKGYFKKAFLSSHYIEGMQDNIKLVYKKHGLASAKWFACKLMGGTEKVNDLFEEVDDKFLPVCI